MRKLVALASVVIALAGCSMPGQENPALNMTGTWTGTVSAPPDPAAAYPVGDSHPSFTLSDVAGDLSGVGSEGNPISGKRIGTSVRFTWTFTSGRQALSIGTLTADGKTMTGTETGNRPGATFTYTKR